MGGEGHERRTGRRFDRWQGQVVRDGPAQRWCNAKGYRQTRVFQIEALGWSHARTIAIEWSFRMQYMYDADIVGLLETEEPTKAVMDAYMVAEAFAELANGDA